MAKPSTSLIAFGDPVHKKLKSCEKRKKKINHSELIMKYSEKSENSQFGDFSVLWFFIEISLIRFLPDDFSKFY